MKNYMIIKNKLIYMVTFMFLAVSVLPTQVGATPPPQGSTTPPISCYNFSTDFYYGMIIPQARIQEYRSTITNPAYLTYVAGITKLHQILEAEGYPIPSDEKNKKFGKATASSLVKYQTTQKVAIGEDPNGLFTEKTRNVINQKYGCISKATINLTEPNANSVRARGEVIAIKWDAAKIPNTTDVTIQYVDAQNSSASTTITTQSGVRNGKGQYNWTVPSNMAPGQYKILVSLTGATKSDVSAKSFEIRDKALEITSPTVEVQATAGSKIPVTWKTSTAIKPADKIKVSLVGTLVSGGVASTTIELGRVVNNGALTWAVPDRVNNKVITGTSTFNIVLQTESGLYTSTSTSVIKILPSASTVTSSITVSQPTSGAQYTSGQVIPIKWTSTGLKTTDDVQISLVANSGPLSSGVLLATVKNNGTYNWTVPLVNTIATTTLNQFKIVVSSVANTTLRGTGANFSIVPVVVPVPVVVTAPKITVWNIMGQAVRGNPIIVNWSTNTSFGSGAKVYARLMRTNGTVETEVAKTSPVTPYTNSITLTIPANAVASATATTNDYKVVLVVTGLPSGVVLDATSDITTDSFSVVTKGQNATLSASTNIPAADAGVVYKGSSLAVNIASTNITNNTEVIAKLVTSTGQATNVAVSTKGKLTSNATALTLNIPTTLANGTYKVQVTSTVDTRPLEAFTTTFEVRDRPVVLPKITIGTVPASIERGVSYTLNWTSNSAVLASEKVKIELYNTKTGLVEKTFVTSLAGNLNTYPVLIPATTATTDNTTYKLKITPVSGKTNFDPTSVLISTPFGVTTRSGELTATLENGSVVKGNTANMILAGTVPSTSKVTATLVRPNETPVEGFAGVVATFSAGKISFPIPANVPVGAYKFYVSTMVDTKKVSTYSSEFTVVNPSPTFTLVGTPTINRVISTTGKTNSMTATFEYSVKANGASLAKIVPANVTVAFEDVATGAMTLASTVTVTSAVVANDKVGNQKVVATINASALPASANFKAKVTAVAWTMGTTPNTTTGIENTALSSFVTPVVAFVK